MTNYKTIINNSSIEIDYGEFEGFFFLSLNKRDFIILEYFLKLLEHIAINQLILFNIDGFIDGEYAEYIKKEKNIESTLCKNGLIIDGKYVINFLQSYLQDDPGDFEFSFYESYPNINLNEYKLPNCNLLKYSLSDNYKIAPKYQEYFKKYNPFLHFLDSWDRQEIVFREKDSLSKFIEIVK